MEGNSTSNVNLNLANSLYKEAEKFKKTIEKGKAYVEKIENNPVYNEYKDMDDLAFENMKYSEDLDEEQKEVLNNYELYKDQSRKREELIEALKDAEPTRKSYIKNIHIAISKYIVQAEKEIANLEKQIKEFEQYIEKDKAKLAELEADPEKNKLVIEDLKSSIEAREAKLKTYTKELAKLQKELEKNKVKFADYLELADEEIGLEEEKVSPDKGDKKETSEEEKTSPDKGDKKEASEEEKTSPDKDDEKDVSEEEKSSQDNSDEKGAPAGKTTTEKAEKSVQAEPVAKEESKETDVQAFNRIYKLMKNRKTRDSISREDIDKMIDIMSDPEKYKELKIDTSRFLKLPFFPSTAEKIFKQIGKHLDKDVKTTLGAKVAQELVDNKELTKWESVTDLGYNQGRKTKAEVLLEEAFLDENTPDDKVEQLADMQIRLEKFRNAATTMYDVRMSRNELKVPSNMLGEAKEPLVAPDEDVYDSVKKEQEQGKEAPDVIDYSDNPDYQAFMGNRPSWGDLVPPEEASVDLYEEHEQPKSKETHDRGEF
ncbi:MAG: hypothetical protein IKV94_01235 [Clostridia bacterium]|nr:hypothetical protein [Clostridia bacterium]